MAQQIIYEPFQRVKLGWIKTWRILFLNIIHSWDLIFQLFKRDFFMQYKKSFVGMGWIFLSPIMGVISWVFMNSTGILTPGDVGIPYPAYVLLSTSIFGLFGGFYGSSSGTLTAGAGFINQVNYPHDVLLIKQAMVQLAGFVITFSINIIVLICFGVIPSWMTILIPLFILPIFFLGAAIGLLSSMIEVVAVDLNKMIAVFMGLLLYLTPVIYSPKTQNPVLQQIIKWNPLTYLIGGTRDAIIYGRIDHIDRYLFSAAISFIFFLISWRLFYISEQKIIEKMI
ncbi:MAG: ABC transporter permease [Bacteroidales bacterium]